MIATACYLIDALCLRVGDEKDPDEADTVGATTLRPEHITLHPDHVVEFKFLGKDSVLWHQRIELPPMVHENLAYLVENARPSASNKSRSGRDLPQVFPHITSRDVNSYLSTIQPGLSAKVFRTHHATEVVRDSLAGCGVTADDPEYAKREAMVLANLDAAILCNHTKQAPAKWAARKVRMREQRQRVKDRVAKYREQVREYRARRAALVGEAKEKTAAASDKQRPKVRQRYRKRRAVADRRITAAKDRLQRARVALGKVESRNKLAGKGRTWNLGTSLKSYIDPRVCYRWGRQVDYEVIAKYYPKALQRKFAWVADSDHQEPAGEVELGAGGNGENQVE
jgi:DNA topoisomerase-1